MKFFLVAGIIITLPALVVIFFFLGHEMVLPALGSLAMGSLPFIVAALLLRKHGAGEDSH